MPIAEMAALAGLPLTTPIGECSTGMKQRVKLLTCFGYENQLIFMDEPTSNLDNEGYEWWKQAFMLLDQAIVLVASNDEREINCCMSKINL